MPPGLDKLKHVVVLMMENRSFDHMLGALKAQDSRIDGLTGNESNPDTTGAAVRVQPVAAFSVATRPRPGPSFSGCRLADIRRQHCESSRGEHAGLHQRLQTAGRKAKIYYYDQASSTMEIVNLLQNQPQFFGTYDQFLKDCNDGTLPDYSFVEPNYSDHEGDDGGEVLASDQHPDYHVGEGERFIASVYNAIRANPAIWESTALLIVYDEHGGIYDHVVPPACTPDGFVAQPKDTQTGRSFAFDRLGVRVPAILVSPWVAKGTVVSPLNPDGIISDERNFEHASIPATLTKFFLGNYDPRSPREQSAQTFLDLLSQPTMRTDDDLPSFDIS